MGRPQRQRHRLQVHGLQRRGAAADDKRCAACLPRSDFMASPDAQRYVEGFFLECLRSRVWQGLRKSPPDASFSWSSREIIGKRVILSLWDSRLRLSADRMAEKCQVAFLDILPRNASHEYPRLRPRVPKTAAFMGASKKKTSIGEGSIV